MDSYKKQWYGNCNHSQNQKECGRLHYTSSITITYSFPSSTKTKGSWHCFWKQYRKLENLIQESFCRLSCCSPELNTWRFQSFTVHVKRILRVCILRICSACFSSLFHLANLHTVDVKPHLKYISNIFCSCSGYKTK